MWTAVRDQSQEQSESRDELVEALRDEISHLRRESERKDEIIMSLSLSNAELSRTIRALEAPASPEPPRAPSEAAEQPGRLEPQPSRRGRTGARTAAPVLVAEDVRG
jgi:hypothetical protein